MDQKTLSTDEAMTLQQIYEDGEDDIRSLSYELGMSRRHVIAEVLQLERKGLLILHDSFDGLLLTVSQRGKAVIRRLWPEAKAMVI